MNAIFWIGVAGLCGTLIRYVISTAIDHRVAPPFPAGTLVVNLAGCFLAGLVYARLQSSGASDPLWQAVILTGFLGGLTTFSAYGLQITNLLRSGELWTAVSYMTASNAVGLAFVWLGLRAGESF